jgi:hypothetical protein
MLSTIKNKISREVSDGDLRINDNVMDEREATNLRSCESVQLPGVVSHIPSLYPTARVSVSGTTSAASSLASVDYHPFGPLSRKSDDESFEGSPPLSLAGYRKVSESCESAESQAPYRKRIVHIQSAKNEQGKTRKRSVTLTASDIRDQEASPSKRRRLEGKVGYAGLNPLAPTPTATLLLARQMDDEILNPLHAFVRKQIEIFTATRAEMAQPAPGRKNPIQLHQVGLRCIHCRDLPVKDKGKRAVCYPSSVGRVYHSVSDMKFDHFGACKGIPDKVRARFNELKEGSKKKPEKTATMKSHGCSSSTAQYYHDSARQLGMMDNRAGVFMADPEVASRHEPQVNHAGHLESGRQRFQQQQELEHLQGHTLVPPPGLPLGAREHMEMSTTYINSAPFSQFGHHIPTLNSNISPALMMSQDLFQHSLMSPSLPPFFFSLMTNNANATPKPNSNSSPPVHRGAGILASPKDQGYLNPLHCFVRRHVEVFAADKDDIAAPSPGRKHRVLLGQVGIRCVQCASLPPKERVKRAVCFPPSVNGIYHSVSNMKFDHFGICRGLSNEDRDEFTALRKLSGRRGAAQGASKGACNSTAQYYHDSALRLGLIDTDEGIRFKDSVVSKPESATTNESLTIPTSMPNAGGPEVVKQSQEDVPYGISALVIAATDPTVRAAYRIRQQSV